MMRERSKEDGEVFSYNLLYYPGHGEGHDAYRHKIDYFLGGAVSPHTESVEGIVDCCQQPVGDRV